MKKLSQFLVFNIALILVSVFIGCWKDKENTENATEEIEEKTPIIKAVKESELIGIMDTEKMSEFKPEKEQDNSQYYDDPEFEEFYKKPVNPPPFNFSIDCSNKSLAEIRCLRNEIYARHGYLFKDAVLRGYFNQFKWYQPIFWDEEFKIKLTKKEQWFVDKLVRLEEKHKSRNYIERKSQIGANMGNIVNSIQFGEIPDTLLSTLSNNGIAVVEAKHEQLFHVYDQNVYDCIPNFVTTDLYVQLLHMHYSNLMKRLEKDVLYNKFYDVLSKLSKDVELITLTAEDTTLQSRAGKFTWAYFAIASNLFYNNDNRAIPDIYTGTYEEELLKIDAHSEIGSDFLNYELFDYSQLKPRGHYTHSEELAKYFKGVKWLLTAPFIVSSDEGLTSAIITAYCLKKDGLKAYKEIESFMSFIAGKPDNLSLIDLVEILQADYNDLDLNGLLSNENLKDIRAKLIAKENERIVIASGDAAVSEELKKKRMYFMAGRYTFDAEILQRLVYLGDKGNRREMPKGLDVYATLGSEKAEDLLINTFKEAKNWPAYPDTLNNLKKEFSAFNSWTENAYTRRMYANNSLLEVKKNSPYFMHYDAWLTKSLTTALAGWTQLKHEVVLYAKQPSGAQCGEGGIPPPEIVGYVEPNVAFWKNAQDLLEATSKTLKENDLETEALEFLNKKLINMAQFFEIVSRKELSGEKVSDKEHWRLAYIGGEVENLTLTIMDTDHFQMNSPERQIALATDVYTHNGTDGSYCLQEAVGYGNEIFVVVEINGLLYLTRGAVLSYYEFKHPSGDRLTDEKWQSILLNGDNPPPPAWTTKIFVPIKPLKTKPTYSSLIAFGC